MYKREKWIDLTRGFAILLVIIGHSCDRTLNSFNDDVLIRGLDRFIYGFHMALFFSLSGYTSAISQRKKSDYTMNFILKKFIDLILPYSFFAVLIWFGKMVFSDYVIVQTNVKDLVMMYIQPYAFLWFIYVLFEMEIVSYIFDKIRIPKRIEILILVLIQFTSLFIETGYRSIDKLMFFLPFFFMGKFLVDNKAYLHNNKIIITASAVFTVCSAISFFADEKFIQFLKVVTSYSGIMVSFSMFTHLCETHKFVHLEHIGKNSIYYYIMHSVFVSAIRILLIKFLNLDIPLLWVTIMSCGTLVCCSAALIVIKKINFLDFFFRPRKYLNKEKKDNAG